MGGVVLNKMDLKQKHNFNMALIARSAYQEGKSLREISKQLGVSHTWVWAAVRGRNQSIIYSFRSFPDMLSSSAKTKVNKDFLKVTSNK